MRLNYFVLILFIVSCGKEQIKLNPLENVLNSNAPEIKNVLDSIDRFEIQICYSEIIRRNEKISFKDYNFNLDDSCYFYPASSVKFPIAVLALEKIYKDNTYSIDTPFYVEDDSVITTIKKDIKDIFAVSGNKSYNRLFEYLGKDYINEQLHQKGLKPSRISHRLSTKNAFSLQTKPLVFYENDSTLTHTDVVENRAIEKLQLRRIKKGIGYYANGELIMEPFDFSLKNYLPVSTLHNTMKRVIFPEKFSEIERFNFSESHREFLLNCMSSLPRDAGYTSEEFYDSYVKFFIYGDSKDPIPEHIKIYNKVGYAYGYLTDCAYINDLKNNVEFILTATIHVNKDGIFNNDIYEYETVGIPFMAELGRQLHKFELSKKY